MLEKIKRRIIECPHCGHHVPAEIDPTQGDQDYYDECPACCRDIHLKLHIDEYRQVLQLTVDSDDEQVF